MKLVKNKVVNKIIKNSHITTRKHGIENKIKHRINYVVLELVFYNVGSYMLEKLNQSRRVHRNETN